MQLSDNWFSTIAEADNGFPIFIAGRDDIDAFRLSGKFPERVEIYWTYQPDYNAMPSEADGLLMEQVQTVLKRAIEKDKLGILTGVYTGNMERTLVFYVRTSVVFGQRLNEALSDFEMLPITLYVEKDTAWNEYLEMCEIKPYAE